MYFNAFGFVGVLGLDGVFVNVDFVRAILLLCCVYTQSSEGAPADHDPLQA